MPPRLALAAAHTEGFALVQRTTQRFGDAVLALPAADLTLQVPGMEWTVGEVVAHMQSVYERYTVDLRRAPSVADLAAQNQEDVDRLGVDPASSVSSMHAQLDTLATFVPLIPPDRTFPFHGGGTTTMAGGWGNLMGELLAHGDDIGRATSWSFTVPGDDLEVTWCHTIPLLNAWLSPDYEGEASWDLQFPFGTVELRFTGGTLGVGIDDGLPVAGAHRTIAVGDAADFTLTVPYRRRVATDTDTRLLQERFAPL